jgi:hypothetical protein
MSNYLPIIIIFILLPLLGFGMFKAARWSRIKNEELKAKHEDSQEQALKDMLHRNNVKGSIAKFYTSSVSKPEAIIGKVLAVSVVTFFIILALLMVYYGWKRI